MHSWKVTIVNKEKTIELKLKARSYSDAYIRAEIKYPDCRVISIKVLRPS